MSLEQVPKHHRFPVSIISHAVWRYHRFNDSYRDIQEELAYRGIIVSHETIHSWCIKFAAQFRSVIKKRERKPKDKWHLDEMTVKINGEYFVLWRAVDADGYELDVYLQKRRNKKSAMRFLTRLLVCYPTPRVIVTDKLRSYIKPIRQMCPVTQRFCSEGYISSLTTSDLTQNFTAEELNSFVTRCIINKSIEVIEIKEVKINSTIEKLLGEALPLNNSVKKLELNNLQAFDSVNPALKELLQFNTSIEQLIISNNSEIDQVLSYIAPDLIQNIKIRKLVLTNNSLGSEGLGLISQIIDGNTSFNEIDLSHQPLTGKLLRELFDIIGKSKHISFLRLSNT